MPGLSQLKKFNKDLLSIGDEVTLRAGRGEKPVRIPIPKEIEDIDDSDDFVLGMPENEAAVLEDDSAAIDEDLSDLINMGQPQSSTQKQNEPVATFEAPDLSSLLNPINVQDDASAGTEMPDLSMFMEEEIPEEEAEEPEPEEVSIADMGLEALLAGGGFDGSEPTEEDFLNESDDDFDDFETVNDDILEVTEESEIVEEPAELEDLDELEELGDEPLDFDASVLESSQNTDITTDSEFSDIDESLFNNDTSDGLENLDDGLESLDDGLESINDGLETQDDGIDSGMEEISLEEFGAGDDSGLEPIDDVDNEFGIPMEDVTGKMEIPSDLKVNHEKHDESATPKALFDFDDTKSFDINESPLNVEPSKTTGKFGDTEDPDLELIEIGNATEEEVNEAANNDSISFDLDDLDLNFSENESKKEGIDSSSIDIADLGLEPIDDIGSDDVAEKNVDDDFNLDDIEEFHLPDDNNDNSDDGASFDLPEADALTINESDDFELPTEDSEFEPLEDISEDGIQSGEETFDIPESKIEGLEDVSDFDLPEDISDNGESTDLESTEVELTDFDDISNFDLPETSDTGLNDITDTENFELPDEESVGLEEAESFDMPEADSMNLDDAGDFNLSESDSIGLDDIGNFDLPDTELADTPQLDDAGSFELSDGDTAGLDDADSFDLPDGDTAGLDDFGLSDVNSPSFDAEDTIPDYGDDFNAPADLLEDIDTSALDEMDFNIEETDSKFNNDFELGSNDEFAMEGEFEIPGFSDVETVKEEKSKTNLPSSKNKQKTKAKKSDEDDEENLRLPPNTLSDAQYKRFLSNLNEYPLNVRLAFEDFIVQDEFTDDAEFEIIEKILNKAPARQVASQLEKMLDISLPVPRDYEHRTAEEYEAYKKSLSYQLRNKIIPGMLIGLLALLVGWGLFNFGKNCIYKPIKASNLYKQGYALLEQNEYPQSEMKFDEAVTYRLNKKWFFNYARGYREHKQYQRAGKMYKNILLCFKHDKSAGLEYADMELNDLANYEKAEEIVRREILDYHINDAAGILKLGDVYLEWGTEKEPAKLEDARAQYATLLQLYGENNLYLSRMLRYFIRSDNLRQVIQLKQVFEPKEKSLSGEDWTELSGYLLEKSFGPLPPEDEYLRFQIEGIRSILLRAVKTNPESPIALYNLSKFFVASKENAGVEPTLKRAIEKFNSVPSMKKRDIYKYIDAYRLLGEHYIETTDYLQAQEQLAEGLSLYATERDNAGFEGTPQIGKMYEDLANIKYTVSGDYDEALLNYKNSVDLENDSPIIRYRIGFIQYKKKNYAEALGSFMKAGDGNVKERNLMLAMANTLSLRGDDYAAEGYYNQLINKLDTEMAEKGLLMPQVSIKDYDIVNTYLYAANNYGVTLYRLAKRTGNSSLNAEAIVQLSQSIRAWDALTRNQESMIRLGGSNLAEQNIAYITHKMPDYEPAIYTDIPKTLTDYEKF